MRTIAKIISALAIGLLTSPTLAQVSNNAGPGPQPIPANQPTTVNIPSVFQGRTSNPLNTPIRSYMGIYDGTIRTNPGTGANSNKLGSLTGLIGPGSWSVTAPQQFLASTEPGNCTYGYSLSGDADSVTQILYNPASSGPAFNNNNKLLGWTFKDIEFNGADLNSDFIDSASNGCSQQLTVSNVSLTGDWQYLFNLTGLNNNSEYLLQRDNFLGTYTCGLNVASAVGSPGDQFLNYWFENIKDDSQDPLICMYWGGHVVIRDSDQSGFAPASPTFKYNLYGNTHAQGVTYFVSSGTRHELKNANAKVMYSEWPQGTILFDADDESSQSYQAWAVDNVYNQYRFQNVKGPKIDYHVSDIMGQTQFDYAGSDALSQKSIVYDHVDFDNYATFAGAFVFDQFINSPEPGSIPVVHIRNSRPLTASVLVAPNADLNWRQASQGFAGMQAISFKTAYAKLPASTNVSPLIQFDSGAVIADILVNVPAGAVTDGGTVTPEIEDEAGNVLWTDPSPFVYSAGQVAHYTVLIDLGTAVDNQIDLLMSGSTQSCPSVANYACDVIILVAG